MKKLINLIASFLLIFAAPAIASADTTIIYKSSIGVLIFIGLLALIVVAQLVPALILALGFVKALMSKSVQTARKFSKS